MKHLIAASFLVLVSSLFAQPVSGPGGNYWPLFCKTGPTAKVEVDNLTTLRVFFEPGPKPAGNDFSGLRPGQCSWPDRVPRKDELLGYYGEMFMQWECPPLISACLISYDDRTGTYKGSFPWFKDPAGIKFKVWLRKDGGVMRILGTSSPKFEYSN